MVIGLVGLLALALPAFGHARGALSGHGGVAHGLGHSALHGGLARGAGHSAVHGGLARGVGRGGAPTLNGRGVDQALVPADVEHRGLLRLVPSPRAVFSALALFGAFGNAGVHAFHLSPSLAGLAAVAPALFVEWALVRRVWNLIFRYQAAECSPLSELLLAEASAVTRFRNGRGMVSTVRDGRLVQLRAQLRESEEALTVNVGDRLIIEEVDARRERVLVSLLR